MAHETVLTLLVMGAAAAMALQAWFMWGLYQVVRGIQREVEGVRADFKQRFDPLAQSISEIVADARQPLRTIVDNLAEVSRLLRESSIQADRVVADLLEKSRLQIIRVDQMMSDIVQRVEGTAEVVQRSILAPLQELAAVIKGIKAAVDFLLGRRRPATVREATQDEQMFI